MADNDKEMGAAYVPWATFKKAIEDLSQGLPNQIDRSVWKSQSWGTQSQLITAFKFLGLTDDKGKPSDMLTTLVDPDTDEESRKLLLKAVFEERYRDLFALDLTKATPEQLDKAMANYKVTGETREKAIRFFLSGLLYLGIPVSKHLQPKTTNGGAPRRGRRPGKKAKAEAPPPTPTTPVAAGGTAKSITLKRGETLTLSATADFFAMDPTDRKFVFDELIERMEKYEQENPPVKAGQDQAKEGGDGDEARPTVKA